MFPVRSKSRISHIESYPLKASEISNMLTDVPQAEVLQIAFWRYSTQDDRTTRIIPLVRVSYFRGKPGISTPNYAIDEWLGPKWEIRVSSIPRSLRHRINALLIAEGLPQMKEWLVMKRGLHGRFGNENITTWYDMENDGLLYKRE